MASPQREVVLCHSCENEWWRDEHGLECPSCHEDFVEIIDPANDPRQPEPSSAGADDNSSSPHHLHEQHHNQWDEDPPSPVEPNIDHFAFTQSPGVHFERTFARSSGGTRPASAQQQEPAGEPLGGLFGALGGFLQGLQATTNNHTNTAQTHGFTFNAGTRSAPGSPRFASVHVAHGPAFSTGPMSGNEAFSNIHTILQTMAATMQASMGEGAHNHVRINAATAPPGTGFAEMLRQMMDPANAVSGDAVFTQEAFDRVMSQMMDQNGGSSAPGPASAAAIAALPKKSVEKSMLGSDGQAECSVCMDNVEIGDEVTVLPCNHWFHEHCVGIWLKEHDTCPHCRKSITAADGPATQPRSPHQAPQHDQHAHNQYLRPGIPLPHHQGTQVPFGAFTQPGIAQPYVPGGYPSYPEPRNYVNHAHPTPPYSTHPSSSRRPSASRSHHSSTHSRRSSQGSRTQETSSSSSGVTGWFRNLRSGSRGSDS